MTRHIHEISYGLLDHLAEEFYMKMPGNTSEGMNLAKQYCKGMSIRYSTIFLTDDDVKQKQCYLREDSLYTYSYNFSCIGFKQIVESSMIGAGFYLMVSDECEPTGQLLDDYYNHMWQTAYMDAARAYIKSSLESFWIEQSNEVRPIKITNSYGPGFYGMGTGEIQKFYTFLGGSDIGVSINGHMLNPAKSCTGVFLVIEAGMYQHALPCETCAMDGQCELCSAR